MKTLAPLAGWTALISGLLALLTYILLPQLDLWLWSFAGLSAVNALVFIVVDRDKLKRALRSRQALYGMNATVLVVVVMGILVFANLLAFRHKEKFDFTETGCTTARGINLYQHVARGLSGGDYFVINSQFTSDSGRSALRFASCSRTLAEPQ